MDLPDPLSVERRVRDWAYRRDDVRAVLLTGSRGRGDGAVDALSDYDLIVVVADVAPFAADHAWLEEIGEPLAVYWDPPSATVSNVALFADDLKADLTLCTAAQLDTQARELDAGYRVWLDKDALAASLPPPSRRPDLPVPPTRERYLQAVEEFLSDVPYVAKCLHRRDLMPARWCLDVDMRETYLRPMLEWRAACDEGWSVPHGILGRGMRRRLPADLWARVEATYAAGTVDASWDALFATVDLYADAARQVGAALGFDVPEARIARVRAHAQRVHADFTAATPPDDMVTT